MMQKKAAILLLIFVSRSFAHIFALKHHQLISTEVKKKCAAQNKSEPSTLERKKQQQRQKKKKTQHDFASGLFNSDSSLSFLFLWINYVCLNEYICLLLPFGKMSKIKIHCRRRTLLRQYTKLLPLLLRSHSIKCCVDNWPEQKLIGSGWQLVAAASAVTIISMSLFNASMQLLCIAAARHAIPSPPLTSHINNIFKNRQEHLARECARDQSNVAVA